MNEGATYLLPIKSSDLKSFAELTNYLRQLRGVDVVIVDGSPEPIFSAHARRWREFALHVPPDNKITGANGKARGVLTGLKYAHEKIVIADDDVRYSANSLRRILEALDAADVVRPQNYFSSHTWHTLLDTGRTLLNRVSGGDWPGTLAVRREALRGGYDPNVMFENLELVRTVVAHGGIELNASDIYVARTPPSTARFWEQRVRQAYDEFARPERMGAALAVIPLMLLAARHPKILAASAGLLIVAAEAGRRRNGGRRYFPAISSAAAPLWVIERGVCAWLAVIAKLQHGGVRYGGTRVAHAATPLAKLRKRAA